MKKQKSENFRISDPTILKDFLHLCRHMGFLNNSSLSAIKWQWLIDEGGSWWVTQIDGNIASLSGIHPFKDGYRALFRGVQTFQRPSGLNKYHMSSYPFAEHLPLQMEWAQIMSKDSDVPIYITTNVENDASGKMLRINKMFSLLEKSKIVDFEGEEDVYYTKQNIWKVNKTEYHGHRS